MPPALDTYRNLDLPGLNHRRVDVWVPPDYAQDPVRRFPVLYMQDGQNIFRPRLSIGAGWRVAETVTTLAQQERITPPIVVGITSTLNRVGEYLPQKAYERAGASGAVNAELRADKLTEPNITSDLYLRWMVDRLKPMVDSNYRTLTGPENTAVMGSSMGGLISLYALCEYPGTFGMAGCLSTHWVILGDAMLDYLRETLPAPGMHKLYFDRGTEGLDSRYTPWQDKVDSLLLERGWRKDRDFSSWVFPGEGHHENYWAGRLHIPLTFFFGTQA